MNTKIKHYPVYPGMTQEELSVIRLALHKFIHAPELPIEIAQRRKEVAQELQNRLARSKGYEENKSC